MSVEQNIIDAFKSLLPLCNEETGYNYDWSSCTVTEDADDPARIKDSEYPFIDIGFTDEISESQDRNTSHMANILTCNIAVIPVHKNATRENIDNVLTDIKKFVNNNHTLNGSCFCAWYDRSRRFTNQIYGKHYGILITLKIRYFQDKMNP